MNLFRQTELPTGLSQAEATELLSQRLGNIALEKKTRSIPKIFFDNVFTLFNLINGILGVVVLSASLIDPQYFRNMLFIGVMIANTFIYSFQEIRAKLAIDRLAILTQSHAIVRRDGEDRQIPVAELVPGDVQYLQAGGQIPVDGVVLLSDGLEIDEALLTGESDPVHKKAGDEVFSGAVVMSGQGYIRVTKVSQDTYSAKIVGDAKREGRLHSPLMRSLNKILKFISWIIFPLGVVLIGHFYLTGEPGESLRSIVSTTGLLVSMLPEGLVLLTSVALAVAVVRLGQVQTLVQTVPSVETLAQVDVLCLDKTGTITTGEMSLLGLVDLKEDKLVTFKSDQEANLLSEVFETHRRIVSKPVELKRALQALSTVFPNGNATQSAISQIFRPESDWQEEGHIGFSSQRKWSGASFSNEGTWYLGAAELLLPKNNYHQLIENISEAGYRVVMLAHSSQSMTPDNLTQETLVEGITPRALLIIADEIRSDVAQTLDYFTRQGVQLKIISGDHPKTLEAVAKRAGIKDFDKLADLSQYDESDDYHQLVQDHLLFGRVSPFQKRKLLKALQDQGHIVAMTGDGVNDVLALKDADCGVAMASGSDAARAVADIILLDNQLSRMIDAVNEGRQVINNIQRVASLFLIKTTYAILFALSILPLNINYPIMPIQGSLISSLTVGIPAFILGLKPNKERVMGRFLANVMPMAWPAGLSAATMLILLELAQKWFAISDASLSTYGTFILISISLRALFAVSRPFDAIKVGLFAFCTIVPLSALVLFPSFLMIELPKGKEWLVFFGLILVAFLLTELIYRFSRSYPVRKLVRRILGKSREDILKEEADRLRALRPKKLQNLRNRFNRRRRFRLKRRQRQSIEEFKREAAKNRNNRFRGM